MSKVVDSTTDYKGNVYLLSDNGTYFSISSKEKIRDGIGHDVISVGAERYVRKRWKAFIVHNSKFSHYDKLSGMAVFSLHPKRV